MRWIVVAIFAIVGFILALLAAGAMLPEKHVVSRSLTINKPVVEVWQVLTDHAQDPKWRPDVVRVTRVADRNGHPVWEEKYKNGDTMLIETMMMDAPKRMERKIVDQSAFGGVWVYELAPSAEGNTTTIKITELGEVYNPGFRFIGRFIIGLEATVEKYLTDLATKFGTKAEFRK